MKTYNYEIDAPLFDLLTHSADIMHDLSLTECVDVDINQEHRVDSKKSLGNCQWYHASWIFSRIANLVHTPDYLNPLYSDFFLDMYDSNKIDILICGAADYTILYHIFQVVEMKKIHLLNITIMDICSTPLQICKWYIDRFQKNDQMKLNVSYLKADAFNTTLATGSFDLITTYCFISRFPADQQPSLISEWCRLLKRGGAVITSNGLSPQYGTDEITYKQEQIESFINRAKDFYFNTKLEFKTDVNEIIDLISLYAHSILEYSIPDEQYVLSLFSDFQCDIDTYIVRGEIDKYEPHYILRANKL